MKPVHQLRPVAGDVEPRSRKIVGGHVFEDAGLLLIHVKFRDRCDVGVSPLPAHFHGHDPVRIGIRQRLQQYRVDHRKDGRVCTDAKRQRRYRGEGKAGAFDEQMQRMFHVIPQVAHRSAPFLEVESSGSGEIGGSRRGSFR